MQKQEMLEAIGTLPEELLLEGAVQAERLGLAVDFTLVNQEVLQLAGTYRNEWWNNIQRSTQSSLRTAIQTHIESGEALSVLEKRIEPLFGAKRAQAIASTEVTRLYADGNATAYQDAGIGEVEFQTVRDARVDPDCDDLQGERFPVGQVNTRPPIHTRCRCWIAPVVEGKPITEQQLAEGEVASELADLGPQYYQKWVTEDFAGADEIAKAWRESASIRPDASRLQRILKERYVGSRTAATEFRQAIAATLENDSLALVAMNPKLKEDARFVVNLIRTAPPQETLVYRSLSFPDERLFNEFLAQHKVGKTIDIPLGSATYDEKHSRLFWEMRQDKVRYEVLSHRGLPISPASKTAYENEVLLSGRFRVDEITRVARTSTDPSHWRIVLRQTDSFDPV